MWHMSQTELKKKANLETCEHYLSADVANYLAAAVVH